MSIMFHEECTCNIPIHVQQHGRVILDFIATTTVHTDHMTLTCDCIVPKIVHDYIFSVCNNWLNDTVSMRKAHMITGQTKQ